MSDAQKTKFLAWADLTWQRAKKAYAAGIAGAVAALGLVSIAGLWNDGLDWSAVGQAAVSVAGAFVLAFITTFLAPANATAPPAE